MTNSATTVSTHPFAHLGPAPYKFVGLETRETREALNAQRKADGLVYTTNLCGGSCDHCGTAIQNVFWFEAADGKRFKVGCDCAEKAHKSDKQLPRYMVAARDAKRAHDAKRRRARASEKRAELKALLDNDAIRTALSAIDHPSKFRAEKGESLLDWAEWMAKHSGAKGEAKTLKTIKDSLK